MLVRLILEKRNFQRYTLSKASFTHTLANKKSSSIKKYTFCNIKKLFFLPKINLFASKHYVESLHVPIAFCNGYELMNQIVFINKAMKSENKKLS